MEPEDESNELTMIITFKRKPDREFSFKGEGQGNQERKARVEMITLPSLEAGRKELLQKVSDVVVSETLINFTRVFKAREPYNPDDYELLCERK